MNKWQSIIASALLVATAACKHEGALYQNPLIACTPDPSVIKAEDGYFYNTTGAELSRSLDLVNWERTSHILAEVTAENGLQCQMWASSLNCIEGKYVCYYARVPWECPDSACIALAISDSPTKPFRNLGDIMDGTGKQPLRGKDPCIFRNTDDGSIWLMYKSPKGGAIIELEKDGTKVKANAEEIKVAPRTAMSPYIYRRGEYYYLIMSQGTCCEEESSTFHLVVTRSKDFRGPYVDRKGLPVMDGGYEMLLHSNEHFIGPGHTSQWITDDNGDTWLLYHSWVAGHIPDMQRALMLDQVTWTEDGWPQINDGTPSYTTKPGPYFK